MEYFGAVLMAAIMSASAVAAADEAVTSNLEFYGQNVRVPEKKLEEWRAILKKGDELERLKAVREGALLHIQYGVKHVYLRTDDLAYPEILAQWESLSKHRKDGVRLSLIRELGYVEGCDPLPFLSNLIRDADHRISFGAYDILDRKQDDGCYLPVEELTALYNEDNIRIKELAVYLMRKHTSADQFRELILDALENDERAIRHAALDYVHARDLPGEMVGPIMMRLWESAEEDKRRTVIAWARNDHSDFSNRFLLDLARTSDDPVAFGERVWRELPGAVDILIERSRDTSCDVRRLVYEAVSKTKWFPEDKRRILFDKGITDESCPVRIAAFMLFGASGFSNMEETNVFIQSVLPCWSPSGYDFITEAARSADEKTVSLLMNRLIENGSDPSFCRAIGKSANLLFVDPLYHSLCETIHWIDTKVGMKVNPDADPWQTVMRDMTIEERREYLKYDDKRHNYVAAIVDLLQDHPELRMKNDTLLESGLKAFQEETGTEYVPVNSPLRSHPSPGSLLAHRDDIGPYTLYQPCWLHIILSRALSWREYLLRCENDRWDRVGVGNVYSICLP